MLELIPAESDDLVFISLVERIVNGAIEALDVREIFVVHVDNWFDWKWLGWRDGDRQGLCVPPFTPNRVRSEKRFTRDEDGPRWESAAQNKPLHVLQRGPSSFARHLDRFSKSAAFVWYSGNTVINTSGSLMFYLSGADGYAWYASFMKKKDWEVHDTRQVTRKQLNAFEQSSRQIVRV